MIYLDYQATTPLAPEALDAMLPWLKDQHANPHSAHRPGRTAKAAIEVAREHIAALLPHVGRVVFTSGATEALNWAIKGSTGPITTWATEHAAVLDTVAAETRLGRAVSVLPVQSDGAACIPAKAGTQSGLPRQGAQQSNTLLGALPRENSGLHVAMLVNNEIGTISPIADLADAAHQVGALFLCDAVQGYGRVAIPEAVDLVAISAHKIYGPKGIGALWVRDGVTLEPLLHGGDQEGGRSGTLSPALCAGFGAAAKLMRERAEADAAHVERLWKLATSRLRILPGEGRGPVATDHVTKNGPTPPAACNWAPASAGEERRNVAGEWHLNGPSTHRYHGNLNLRRPGLDVARLMSDCRDVAFSAGSACASGSGRPSHVLRAIGLSDAQARSSIRLGWGRYTTEAELTEALDRICAAADAQHVA